MFINLFLKLKGNPISEAFCPVLEIHHAVQEYQCCKLNSVSQHLRDQCP